MGQPDIENPFDYTRPIVDPKKAVTRETALQEVLLHLHRKNYVSVLAPLQTGKTTFLFQLRKRITDAFYLDLQGTRYDDIEGLTADFRNRIAGRFPDLGAAKENTLIGLLRELDRRKRFTFLVDEMCSSREVFAQFLINVRAYLTERVYDAPTSHHLFVFAGSTDLVDLTLEECPTISPFNIADVYYLADFSDDELESLIRRLTQDKFSNNAITRIAEITGGHPFLVQYLCHKLFNLPKHVVDGLVGNLTELIDKVQLTQTSNIQSMCSRASRAEPILRSILSGKTRRFAVTQREIRNAYLDGSIRKNDDWCEIRNPIYRKVLRQHFNLPDDTDDARIVVKKTHSVFLCYNSKDRLKVAKLGKALQRRDFKVWLDEWSLLPGRNWHDELKRVISNCDSALICVGKNGIGPWQHTEIDELLSRFVEKKGRMTVIPVLIPGTQEAPEGVELPLVLRNIHWVDLRKGLRKKALDRLEWGITGVKPET